MFNYLFFIYIICEYIFKASALWALWALWADAFYSISRFVRLSVRLSVCVFNFEVPFKRLFAPTSRSLMSNIFAFWMIFPFFKEFRFLGIVGTPYCVIGATICTCREMLCLPYAGFLTFCLVFFQFWH